MQKCKILRILGLFLPRPACSGWQIASSALSRGLLDLSPALTSALVLQMHTSPLIPDTPLLSGCRHTPLVDQFFQRFQRFQRFGLRSARESSHNALRAAAVGQWKGCAQCSAHMPVRQWQSFVSCLFANSSLGLSRLSSIFSH